MFALESQLHAIFLATVALIAILNPFGVLPQFIGMTAGLLPQVQRKLFRNILYTSFVIVIVFLLLGPSIMKYLFKIDINDLRIAGGFLLMAVSIKSLLLEDSNESENYQHLSASELLAKSIVPMAFPMLVGPGTLSTTIVIAEESGIGVAIYAAIGAFSFMIVLFQFSSVIEKILGKLVLQVLSRIALVFIMAIGVRMIIIGCQEIFIKGAYPMF